MRDAIYDFLVAATSQFPGLTVIEDMQGKPAPALPYVSFRFLVTSARVGAIDELRYDKDNDKWSSNGERSTTVSINVFAKNCGEIMEAIQGSLDLPEVVDHFAAHNMAHYGEQGPVDLSALLETKYERRLQIDLFFRYGFSKDSNIGPIEQVQILGETKGQAQDEPVKTEIDIVL